MSQAPDRLQIANQAQPQLAPPGQDRPPGGPSEPPPTPIQQEIRKRLESITEQASRARDRLIELDLEPKPQNPRLAIVRTLKGVLPVFASIKLIGGLPLPTHLPELIVDPNPADLAREREVAVLRQEIIDTTDEAGRVSTQLAMSIAIPRMVRIGVGTTMEDLLDRFGTQINTPEDLALAQRSLDAALAERARFTASAERGSTAEYIRALGQKRNLTVYGLMTLTTTPDLLGFIEELRAPQLPEGRDPSDLRTVLGNANIPHEFSATLIKEADDFTIALNRELDIENTRRLVWQADMLNAIDNGIFAQHMAEFRDSVTFLENPGLYIGLPFKWIDRHYWKPFGGRLQHKVLSGGLGIQPVVDVPIISRTGNSIGNFFGLSPEHYEEFEGLFAKARANKESSWIAYGAAFDNLGSNAWGKLIIEIVGDPTSYIGFGLLKALRGVPLIGGSLYRFEHAWIRTWDLPFIGLQKLIGKVIPKSPADVVFRDMVDHLDATLELLHRSAPRGVPASEMTPSRVKENMNIALEALQNNPQHSGEITDGVRGLLEQPMLTGEEVAELATRVGKPVVPDLLQQTASNVDAALVHSRVLPGGLSHSAPETIELILGHLGAARTPENIRTAGALISLKRGQALLDFESIITFNTYDDFTAAIMQHRRNVLVANQLNPLSAYRSRTAMIMSSLSNSSRLRPAVTTIATTFDVLQRFSYGFTRMYLMSTLYGPYNRLETAAKAVVMGTRSWGRGNAMVDLHRTFAGSESMLPRHLISDTGFLPHAQDLVNAGGTAAAKVTSTRSAFKRIWNTKQNVLTKLYRSADEVFIQRSGRAGREQDARIMNALALRHLFDNAQTGPIIQRISDMVVEQATTLAPHMSPEAVELHRWEMFRRATQGDSESLSTMSAEFVEGFVHGPRVQEIVSQYATLDPPIVDHIVELAFDGDLWRLMRSGELNTRITEAIWQNIFASPELYLARIRELTRGIVDIPPTSLEELQVQVRMLEDLNSATTHIVEQQMSATQVYTRDIRNLEKKDDIWQGQWENIIKPIMDAGEDSARQVVESLLRSLREDGFNLPRQAITQYDELISQELIRIQLLTKARDSINSFTRIMIDRRANEVIPSIRRAGEIPSSTHPLMEQWWSQFNSGRDSIWRETQAEIARSVGSISIMAGAIDALPLPQIIDVSSRPLVLADVAYLYGAAPDGVTAGMYLADLKMMRPKQEWIELVYSQARRVADQTGVSPDSVGFTRDRIGLLYDEHLKSLRISPEAVNLSAPQFKEWEVLHVELQSYGMGREIVLKPSAQKAVDDAAKALLADITSDPIAREVLSRRASQVVPQGTMGTRTVEQMRVEDLTTQINAFVSARPGQKLLFHGGPALDGGVIEQGFVTNSLETAMDAAETAARGREGEGFVHIIDSDRASLGPSHEPAARGEDFELLAEAPVEISFDIFEESLGVTGRRRTVDELTRAGGGVQIDPNRLPTVLENISDKSPENLRQAAERLGLSDVMQQVDELASVSHTEAVERGIDSIGLDVPSETVSNITDTWTPKRRAALQDAVDEHNINFPVYDKHNIFNQAMRFFVPFWSYEAHRWMYLPRVAIRNPGLTHAWGTYSDNTDRGYLPIPGTSIQISPTRNTIMSGGMQRLVNRDFPEFYDQFPDFANYLDIANRAGFFPNIYMSGIMALPFANKAGISQVGELVPPPIGSALESIIALDPDNWAANALAEMILPNRFRDRRISIRLADNLPEGQGSRAYDILSKKQTGEALTSEETQLWDAAERRSAVDSVFDYMIGLFRLRPPEMVASRKLAKEIHLRYIPVTSEQYDEAHKLGMRIEDYFPNPIELNDELREVESIAKFRGLASQLGESAIGLMLAKQNSYWRQVEEADLAKEVARLDLDDRFRTTGERHITRDEWKRQKRKLAEDTRQFKDDLKSSPEFAGTPIDYEDRIAYAKEHNTLAPIQEPIEEMILYYFSKTPDDFRFFDPDVGAEVIDWNGFYIWRKTLEGNVADEDLDTFLGRIRKLETDLDRFVREDYETYIRPYKNLFGITLDEYSPTEQDIVRQFYSAIRDVGIDTRTTLQDIESGGGKLIARFQSTLSERRRRLRQLDPEIDARLAFWGETNNVVSDRALTIHNGLFDLYGIQAREVVSVETIVPALTQ